MDRSAGTRGGAGSGLAWFRVGVAMIVAGAAIHLGCGDDDGTSPIPPELQELNRNRATWISVAPADYDYRFQWSCTCPPADTTLVRITVVADAVATVVDAVTETPVPDPDDRPYRTIDGLFDWLVEAYARSPGAFVVQYDGVWGYPVLAEVGPGTLAEGFEVSRFRP